MQFFCIIEFIHHLSAVNSWYLVHLVVSLLQRIVLLFVQFGDDGRDLSLVAENNSAFLCQVSILTTETKPTVTKT